MAMEVTNENSALLSNLEVLMLLKEVKTVSRKGRRRREEQKREERVNTIAHEVIGYLNSTPCALQTPEHVSSFMHAIKDFGLTKAEKLQLLNSRPKTMVEMHLMVEESEERFTTDEQMDQLMDTVITNLPGPQPASHQQEEDDDEAAEGEEEEEGAEMEAEEEEEEEGIEEEGGESGAAAAAAGSNYVAI